MTPSTNDPVTSRCDSLLAVHAFIRRNFYIQLTTDPYPTVEKIKEWTDELASVFGEGYDDFLIDTIQFAMSVASFAKSNAKGDTYVTASGSILNFNTNNEGGVQQIVNNTNNESGQIGPKQWERVVMLLVAIVIVGALMVRAFMPGEIADRQYVLFRALLALGIAGCVMGIPGFITADIKIKDNLVLRAGGAIAAFVLVYFFLPAV